MIYDQSSSVKVRIPCFVFKRTEALRPQYLIQPPFGSASVAVANSRFVAVSASTLGSTHRQHSLHCRSTFCSLADLQSGCRLRKGCPSAPDWKPALKFLECRRLTFDLSGAVRRPLEGRVRPQLAVQRASSKDCFRPVPSGSFQRIRSLNLSGLSI